MAFLAARVFRKIAKTIELASGLQAVMIQSSMDRHNMVTHPDEAYYLDQYWAMIEPVLSGLLRDRQGTVLDLGCGQGRVTIPLARWLEGGDVIGVDITPSAIAFATEFAAREGVENVRFLCADALEYANAVPPGSADAALILEVPIFMPRYRELLRRAFEVLRPGGALFVSFRSRYFNLLHSVARHDWSGARLARDAREGHWGGGVSWFSWHTAADVREIIAGNGFAVDSICGIGVLSGIEGDPLSSIAKPSKLSSSERTHLADLELSLAEEYADCGRYILVIASKPIQESIHR